MKRTFPLILALLLGVGPVHAQAPPARLQWEPVGEPFNAIGLFAAGDSVVYAVDSDLAAFSLAEGEWSFTPSPSAEEIWVAPSGDIFITRGNLRRSIDGGATWDEVLDGGETVPFRTPSGALVAGEGDCCGAARSTDGGATWALIEMADFVGFDLIPFDFVALPPSEALPQGRVVGAGRGGVVYSDDDGVTWAPTALVGAFDIVARSAVRAPSGLLYVAANGFFAGDVGGVFESADGVAWERVGTIPGEWTYGYRLVAAGDGALYAIAVLQIDYEDGAPVYRSLDAGRTWASAGPVWTEWDVRLRDLTVGPEGRLWVATTGGPPGSGNIGGVFRTVEPVFTVAEENGASEGPALDVDVYPNPSRSGFRAALTLPEAAEVRVALYDVLGRQVGLLHEGPLAVGDHHLRFDGGSLPTGVYILRVMASGAVTSARILFAH